MIKLTEEQRRELDSRPEVPVRVTDPETDRQFVLVRAEWFDSLCRDGTPECLSEALQAAHYGVYAPLFRSMKAYWRDLPALLGGWWKRGKWVAYWGDVRVGIAGSQHKLIKKCHRMGFPPDQVYYGLIRPRDTPPWEPESFECTHVEFEDDDPESPTAAQTS